MDVTIRIHSWQLSPDHQTVAIDECLDLDELSALMSRNGRSVGPSGQPPIGRRDLVATE
jgi:hypothetical protein